MEMRDFIDKIGSEYVGSYLDIGNTLYCSYPEDWIRILGDRIKKIHFKDYRIQAGGLHGFVDLLAGDVNYPEVVKALFELKEGEIAWVRSEFGVHIIMRYELEENGYDLVLDKSSNATMLYCNDAIDHTAQVIEILK